MRTGTLRPPARTTSTTAGGYDDEAEALALLASVEFGRVVFTRHALPAIRPVNHLLDGGRVVIRTRLSAALTGAVTAPQDTVVAYQADQIDPVRREGWSVVVTGIVRPLTNPQQVARYEQLLQPWIARTMDTVVSIRPAIVTGFRLSH